MLYGARTLQFAGFPASKCCHRPQSEEEIKDLIDRHGMIFVKPVFKAASARKAGGVVGRCAAI